MRTSEPQGAITLQEFCKTYSVGLTSVYGFIKSKKLRSVKCGAKTLIAKRDAETWFNSLPEMGAVKSKRTPPKKVRK